MDEDEECFVFPAITKPYSQVVPSSSPQKDRADSITPQRRTSNPSANTFCRQNNRQRDSSTQSPISKKHLSQHGGQTSSSDQSRRFLRVPPPEAEESIPKRGLLKKSSLRTKTDNNCEVRRSLISIQDVRKYSVVDPSTLKFVQGGFFTFFSELPLFEIAVISEEITLGVKSFDFDSFDKLLTPLCFYSKQFLKSGGKDNKRTCLSEKYSGVVDLSDQITQTLLTLVIQSVLHLLNTPQIYTPRNEFLTSAKLN
ncbi:hypothetical protein EGR_02487 [Echinococcus granulosus]|uniref:Uncharacterized protein n=1 Tax=Echinococcus granulosus TaxID=6210 RepID=W6UPH8_ECHGR|nr:hypothetical protein EGR_02487 [Echinococcus granulosus]EUB62691.1 hypothetical protein EGR_02487 [Echinococcus granulosus]